jgi:hypothetical protein
MKSALYEEEDWDEEIDYEKVAKILKDLPESDREYTRLKLNNIMFEPNICYFNDTLDEKDLEIDSLLKKKTNNSISSDNFHYHDDSLETDKFSDKISSSLTLKQLTEFIRSKGLLPKISISGEDSVEDTGEENIFMISGGGYYRGVLWIKKKIICRYDIFKAMLKIENNFLESEGVFYFPTFDSTVLRVVWECMKCDYQCHCNVLTPESKKIPVFSYSLISQEVLQQAYEFNMLYLEIKLLSKSLYESTSRDKVE